LKEKKMRALARILTTVLAVLLLFSLASCKRGSDVPLSPGLSMIKGEPVFEKDVAMRTDHFTVTPGMMAYFFYDYGGEVLAAIEQSKPFDASRSLHDQAFDEGRSFYDVIMNATLQKVSELLIYCEAAKAAGIGLTADQEAAVEQELSTLAMNAAAYYKKTADEYLQALYGPLMNSDALRGVLRLELLANSYSLTVTGQLEQGITEQAIAEYASANGLSDSTLSRNISYIAIPYVGGKPNEEKVTAVSDALASAPHHETLAGFSTEGTVGKEQDLTPDNTDAAPIAEWLFAAGRRVGDHGRAELDGYTYVLVYTGNGMSYAHVSARMRLYDVAYADWYNGWVERLHFGYNYDILDGYDID
jgi:hypothetical protein